jgi:hypothetical protein
MDKETLRRVWDALQWGVVRDARVIEERAGLPPERTCEGVRAAVRWLRDHGMPVVSNGDGFTKTTNAQWLAECASNLFKRAESLNTRGRGLLKRIEEGWPAAAYEEEVDEMLGHAGGDECEP